MFQKFSYTLTTLIFLGACATKKSPVQESQKDQSWVEELPVAAGTSLATVGEQQLLFVKKLDSFEWKSDALWIAADGYGVLNNGITRYFNENTRPLPRLEVTLEEGSAPKASFESCLSLIKDNPSASWVQLRGEGQAVTRYVSGRPIGLFKIKRLRECNQK